MKEEKAVFLPTYTPKAYNIKITKLKNEKWRLQYSESLGDDIPQKVVDITHETMTAIGIPVKIDKKNLSYDVVWTKDQVFGGLGAEFLAMSRVGDLSLRELLAVATLGLAKRASKKLLSKKPTKSIKQ